jgi:hypothetical protein
MEQEGRFLNLLQQAGRMSLGAGQIIGFNSAGNRILAFLSV